MTQADIRRVTVNDIAGAPNIDALLAEYCAESGIPELGAAYAQVDTYRMLEQAGMLHALGAYQGDRLVGFMFLLLTVLPHFGCMVGTSESCFVASEARHFGTGLWLMSAAEILAREHQARGVLVSAPIDGRLDRLLDMKREWRATNRVYFKELA